MIYDLTDKILLINSKTGVHNPMQVTKEGDYALRAVIYVASCDGKTCCTGEISEAQKIPAKFLARIMPKLVRTGIIQSLPGSKGGYRLARKAKSITFLEVLEAISGPLKLNECLEADFTDCEHEELCAMKQVWETAQEKLNEYFTSVTLDQLNEPPCAKRLTGTL